MTVKDQNPKELRKQIAEALKFGIPIFLEKNGPGTKRCRIEDVVYYKK
jgi:hypothetical protein